MRVARIMLAGAVLVACAPACSRERKQPEIVIPQDQGMPVAPRPARSEGPGPVERSGPSVARPFVHVSGVGYQGYVRPALDPHHWEPTPEDIAALEAKLPAALESAMDHGEVPRPLDLSTYTRQYIGYAREGVPMIEVRFFCEASRNLAHQNVFVSGGGSCIWNTAYDTRAERFRYWRTSR